MTLPLLPVTGDGEIGASQDGAPIHAGGCVQVEVDHREVDSGVLVGLQVMAQVHIEITTLKLGDYRLDGYGLLERKTLPDFAKSVVDGGCSGRPSDSSPRDARRPWCWRGGRPICATVASAARRCRARW